MNVSLVKLPIFRQPKPSPEDLTTVCFRLTRACNYHCDFCLAPPDGEHVDLVDIQQRLKYLCARGLKSIKFTGGEPMLSKQFAAAVTCAADLGLFISVVSNGTLISERNRQLLVDTKSRLKISLHGPPEIHNSYFGTPPYHIVESAIRQCLDSGIPTSIHTVLCNGKKFSIKAWVEQCIALGVWKLSFLPFVPRGSGRSLSMKYGLLPDEVASLRQQVAIVTATHSVNIALRWLDFAGEDYFVLEPDGSLIIERGYEELDEVISTGNQVRLEAINDNLIR